MATFWRLADPLPVPYRSCPTVAAHESSLRCGTGPATRAKLVVLSKEEATTNALRTPWCRSLRCHRTPGRCPIAPLRPPRRTPPQYVLPVALAVHEPCEKM